MDDDHMNPAELAELHRLARSRPTSGRGQLANLGAIRTIERLGRGRRVMPPMPDGWHPAAGSRWEEFDAGDSLDRREFWWAALWRQGLV